MKRAPLKLLAVVAALSFVGVALGNSRGNSREQALAEVKGYKDWTRVTLKPLTVPLDAASLGG
jgi:hypothetical protein